MNNISAENKTHPFFQNSGEMGKIILQHNWSQTSLGEISSWPLSLSTMLATMLHSAFPMFLFWGEELICFYNDAYRPSLGTGGKHPAIGKKGKDVWAEIWPFMCPLLEGVMNTGTPVWYEDQLVPFYRNGRMEDIYWTFSYSPAFGDKGEIHGVVVTCMETTKTVQERKRIVETEERGRLSIEAAELGTFDLNLRTNKIIASSRFAAIFGIESTLNHADYMGAIHPEDMPVREKAYHQAFESGTLKYEARVVWKDNSLHWVRIKGNVYYDEQGKPLKILGVVQDITTEKSFDQYLEVQVKERTEELAKAHQSLLHANQYLQRIINLFKEPLQVLQPVFNNGEIINFKYRITNDAYAAYAHTKPEHLEGKTVGDVFPGYFETTSFSNVVRTFKTGVSETWEIHYDVDGLNIYNIMSAMRMDNEVVVHFTDFTRLKNLELSLLQKVAELERSNTNLEEFARAASHDLKEPIRKIQVFAGQLRDQLGAQLGEDDRALFSKIESASHRMSCLIDDLLLFSHVTLRPTEMVAVSLNERIKIVLEDLELVIQQKGADIQVEKLPIVQGHERQIQQLFQNLISNALKYSKADIAPKIFITSEVTSEDSKPYHHIQVSDNGIGFDNVYSEKIFQLFTRLHGRGEYGGSGVGLSIVKKIAENHDGFIRAESTPGEGSVFSVYLPVE